MNVETTPSGETAGEQAPPTVAVPEAELADLRKRAAQRDEYLEMAQRVQADYENFQKRLRKEREGWSRDARRDVLVSFLAVADDARRALASAPEGENPGGVIEGVRNLLEKFNAALAGHGVREIASEGKVFDPSLHEAILTEETESRPEMTILEELRKGYTIDGVVLRPAQVKVARKPAKTEDGSALGS